MFHRRIPFFYGWVIVGVAMVSSSLMSGLGIWAMSVFIVPMEAELGWSRTTVFLAFTIRALVMGILAPLVGPWLDRKHGRIQLCASTCSVLAEHGQKAWVLAFSRPVVTPPLLDGRLAGET